VPPLRDRREEIPWLLVSELDRLGSGLSAHGLFVESCLLRTWNGNVRAFVAAVREAAASARAEQSSVLQRKHLQPPDERPGAEPAAGLATPGPDISRDGLRAELLRQGGNLTQTAKALGLHRTQLYRILKRFDLRPDEAAEHPSAATASSSTLDQDPSGSA
jgi:transcriptional regulator of acetoin/glycerol metabolism